MAQTGTLSDLDAGTSVATSSALSTQNAEHALAKNLVEHMERHWRIFGERETGFTTVSPETLCVPVLQRAARYFWQKHRDLWPRFAISGTGVSIEFRRIRK